MALVNKQGARSKGQGECLEDDFCLASGDAKHIVFKSGDLNERDVLSGR